MCVVRTVGRFWRVSASTLRTLRFGQRHVPALGGFHGIGGPEDQQVRNGAQGRQMLDRLMRRAVFAEADRIMRHHIDGAHAHQRRKPDRRPAVIGEDQEGAAIGNDAAMQRHAVHRRRHAVLADAVMDIAAGKIARRDLGSCPWSWCCWSR